MAKLEKSTWKSAQGTTEFCVDQYNVKVKYTYKYSMAEVTDKIKEGDIEAGEWAATSLKFSSSQGEGIMGIWMAVTGPNAKNTGSNMYRVAYKSDGNFQLVGWYCNADAKFMRTACFLEQYDLDLIDPNACAWSSTATASIPRPTLTYLSQIAIGVLVMIGSMYST